MPKLQTVFGVDGWYIQLMIPHEGKEQEWGPFTDGERDAFLEAAATFQSPFTIQIDKD